MFLELAGVGAGVLCVICIILTIINFTECVVNDDCAPGGESWMFGPSGFIGDVFPVWFILGALVSGFISYSIFTAG